MNSSTFTSAVVFVCMFGAIWLGKQIRRRLPEQYLSADTKDTVKLSMGLVATMTALVLGLLVSSAKSSYDATRGKVIEMAAKVAFIDRVLAAYGPEARDARSQFRALVEEAVQQMWPGEGKTAQLAPDAAAGNALYASIQALSPKDDSQRNLKSQLTSLGIELGQLRTTLFTQSVPSVSKPMLAVVVAWLIVIFFSFSVLAPPNTPDLLALTAAALSVSGAIFLILELDRPFGGLIQISSQPMLHALMKL